ncbi:DNA translocase FtsK 4TM domain-containing protein [Sandarakinorhabdus sp. DWP1-3-1]|uniref:FtsK/SpoIIIE family DNA translocase n=1 Tax=Sandarakinorhabdus sp. DWP1-3-1 TaxID=2804627 RepID=UPI003CEF693E
MATRAASTMNRPRAAPQGRVARLLAAIRTAVRRFIVLAAALVLVLLAGALVAAILTWSPLDPSFNAITGRLPTNALGSVGSHVSDLLLQLLGWPSLLLAPPIVVGALRLVQRRDFPLRRCLFATLGGILVLAAAAGALMLPGLGAPAGFGGVVGLLMDHVATSLADTAALDGIPVGTLAGVLLAPVGLALAAYGSGIEFADLLRLRGLGDRVAGLLPRQADDDEPFLPRERRAPVRAADDEEDYRDPQPAAPQRIVVEAAPKPAPGKRLQKERQPTLDLGDSAILPSLSLLRPPPTGPARRVDTASLEQNARLLEGVLEDFGVRGRIGEVRPGPVVTMYELEPAPGIKASRVIGLADDIARSMSALSARVAVVPGKNVIGIELPNQTREMVSLSELLGSRAFEDRGIVLPLILGKDIAGEPVIADLAPMPHLLIAGTTGSGKSVGLNAMILSLLYRLGPADCRMIMIDPKMLELKTYDGIPHLLAPVVTDPPKAIRALKWAVEQMEDRYRQMSAINVRSLANFNQKVAEAKASGKPFVRRVQTGWDPDTQEPIIEEEVLDFDKLPLIVVVVDELADLMMTAGKEVEFLIQRLAQKARAAGIHLIMATQRPSVDVITGVIKANLPTRISFQVTSKIDSRTILGEQGAEQLLGKGDMLWMSGGKQVIRVHGPFVTDDEVEAVADHWRRQGMPAYVEAVTEDPTDIDGQWGLDNGMGGGGDGKSRAPTGDEDADSYARAIEIIAAAQKASTSYLQRQLRVGYNNAARLIERMEADGFVSKPDHVGRREVLIDESGARR